MMMLVARSRADYETVVSLLRPYADLVEPWLLSQESVAGWCRACARPCRFRVSPGQSAETWRSLLEGVVCDCGLNGRMRLILAAIDVFVRGEAVRDALVLERLTPLFPHLAARIPNLTGSEYFDFAEPGDVVDASASVRVRNESMMALSFPEASLDLVMHFDVLKHVPDWRTGLRECARVLRDGGQLLFTCPFFYTLDRNIVRAEWKDGAIHHILPPGYHGNPVSPEGRSLVFVHPTWEVFDEMAALGFEDVRLAVHYDVGEGIVSNSCPYPDGHVWPTVFLATRRRTFAPVP